MDNLNSALTAMLERNFCIRIFCYSIINKPSDFTELCSNDHSAAAPAVEILSS